MTLNALELRNDMLASVDTYFDTCEYRDAVRFEITRLAEAIEIIERLIQHKHLDFSAARTQFKTQRIIVRGQLASRYTQVDDIVNTALAAVYDTVTQALGFDLYPIEQCAALSTSQPEDIDHLFM